MKELQEKSKEIASLYAQGMSMKEVASVLKCSIGKVSRNLKKLGINIRSGYVIPSQDAFNIRSENRYILGPTGKKRCLYCQNIYDKSFFDVKKKGVLDSRCKNCLKEKRKIFKLKLRNDPEHYCLNLLTHLKHRAKELNVPFNLKRSDLFEALKRQNYKCYYTGNELDFTKCAEEENRPHNLFPSVDRLNPVDGYVRDNVVWAVFFVNRMKSDLSFHVFVQTIKKILSHIDA